MAIRSARFKLRGLDAVARYIITDLDRPESPQTFSGTELMENGLRIEMARRPAAVVVGYRKAD